MQTLRTLTSALRRKNVRTMSPNESKIQADTRATENILTSPLHHVKQLVMHISRDLVHDKRKYKVHSVSNSVHSNLLPEEVEDSHREIGRPHMMAQGNRIQNPHVEEGPHT